MASPEQIIPFPTLVATRPALLGSETILVAKVDSAGDVAPWKQSRGPGVPCPVTGAALARGKLAGRAGKTHARHRQQ